VKEPSISEIEAGSRTVGEILRTDFAWSQLAFIGGMAPVAYRQGRQSWRPRRPMFLRRLFGASNGPVVAIDDVIGPGTYLKFCLPNEATQATMDFQNWRGYFDRETIYSVTSSGSILNRWVRFLSFQERGFQFISEYLDGNVQARTPTIVFFGADWIRVYPGHKPGGP
jgi:hypothetical protein